MAYSLERVTPESVGIMSATILNTIEKAKALGIDLHSLMVLRHGKVCFEGYWKPYDENSKNHLYSFSKSFTSAAVGFAVDEGLLSYDDRVCEFFPRYIDSSADQRVYSITIEHLLTMTSGAYLVNEATVNFQSDWVRYFLNTTLASFPGEKFNYNSINTYMLSAILRKVTGMGLIEYLTPRLLEPLGIEGAYWEKCPMGRECGGWGFHIETEDMAKFGQLLLNDGKLGDKRILPEGWVKLAGSYHTDNTTDKKYNGHPDVIAGYGYQFWVNRDGRSFRADGMLGQYALVLPELDAVIVTTAGQMEQLMVLDLIWDELIPEIGMIPKNSPSGEDYDELMYRRQNLCIIDPVSSSVPEEVRAFSGVEYLAESNRQSFIPFMCRYTKLKQLTGVSSFNFDFTGDYSLSWTECGETNTIPLVFDGDFHSAVISFFGNETPVSVYSRFIEDAEKPTMEIIMTLVNFPHSSHLTVSFADGLVAVTFNELPSFADTAKFCGDLVSIFRNISSPISKIADKIASTTIIAAAKEVK